MNENEFIDISSISIEYINFKELVKEYGVEIFYYNYNNIRFKFDVDLKNEYFISLHKSYRKNHEVYSKYMKCRILKNGYISTQDIKKIKRQQV